MNMGIEYSIDDIITLVTSESQKLHKIIDSIKETSEKTIPDIINLYYQVTMVQTLVKKIKFDLKSVSYTHLTLPTKRIV